MLAFLRVVLVSAAGVFFVGCSSAVTSPENVEIDETGESDVTAPERVIGDVVYNCGRWTDAVSTLEHPHSVVDFYLWRAIEPVPTAEHVARITAVGGEVHHVFSVPVIRADVPVDAIPGLAHVFDGNLPSTVRSVVSPDRPYAIVSILYSRPVQDADLEKLEQMGLRIRTVLTMTPVVSANAPDQVIPDVRALPGVHKVEHVTTPCLG